MQSLLDQKGRGAFYTPLQIVEPMVRWAIRSSSDRVLDGGAGESVFLTGAAEHLLQLGAPAENVCRQVHGVELDRLAAKLARKALAATLDLDDCVPAIHCGSFFDEVPGRNIPLVEACIGNPPYIRYQSFSGEVRRDALARAAEGGVKLSGLTSSWAPFLVHTCRFIAPGGRLAQVLPAELLQTSYAQPIRDFLVHRFPSVVLVAFDDRVFPGALEEVVLVLASEDGKPGLQVREATDLENLEEVIQGSKSRSRSVQRPTGKWTKYLLKQSELRAYEACSHSPGFGRLHEYGRTDIGVVTGANSFFVLDEHSASGAGIPEEDLRPAISKAEHVQGLRLTKTDMARLGSARQPSLLFYPLEEKPNGASGKYIRSGEWIGLHNRYKCRTRQPWWKVPGVKVPDAFITYMSNETPRVALNEIKAVSTNTVHGIYLNPNHKQLRRTLPLLFVNSVTLLSAEVEGRSYGGGVLKLEPKECDRLLLPRLEELAPNIVEELRRMTKDADKAIRAGQLSAVIEKVDELVLTEGLGIDPQTVTKIRSARARLLGRRKSRMTSRPS
jgi:adenine-specific DNA methylase